jgi:hypothetical protein
VTLPVVLLLSSTESGLELSIPFTGELRLSLMLVVVKCRPMKQREGKMIKGWTSATLGFMTATKMAN